MYVPAICQSHGLMLPLALSALVHVQPDWCAYFSWVTAVSSFFVPLGNESPSPLASINQTEKSSFEPWHPELPIPPPPPPKKDKIK